MLRMHNFSSTGFETKCHLLCLSLVLAMSLPAMASSPKATGHFEVYCDGIGLFLAKLDAVPAPGRLVLFARLGNTFGGDNVGQMKWSDVDVFRDGCIPEGKCERIANGKVWIDTRDGSPKHISGKYELKLNDKLLKGTFVAKKRAIKRPIRLCM